MTIFKSLIQPNIDSCSSIIFMENECEMRSLQLLQNRAMGIILKNTYQMDAGFVGFPLNQTTNEFPHTYIDFQKQLGTRIYER
jgi:hypothetical protein